MPIEWMPRSRTEEDGWRDLRSNPTVAAAVPEARSGIDGIRVPVLEQPWRLPRFPRLRARYVFLALRVVLILLFGAVYVGIAAVQLLMTSWVARLMLAFLVAVAVYRSWRLRRRSHGPADLFLSPQGCRSRGCPCPGTRSRRSSGSTSSRRWTGRTLRHETSWRCASGTSWRWPVSAPSEAGLANLTRRHLLVLAEASELRHPSALAAALQSSCANPESRTVLSTPNGCRLVDEGPAGTARRSP
jgi:hypothetical protein